MENFIARKKAFLEKLKENPQVANSIRSSKYNDAEKIDLFFDPKDETELCVAEKMLEIVIDTLKVHSFRSVASFEVIGIEDYGTIPIVDLFRKIMLALKNDNSRYLQAIIESVKETATPESIAELQFQLISILVNNAKANEYLASHIGFDPKVEKKDSFFELFVKANDVFNLQIVNELLPGKFSTKNPEALAFFERQANKYHELCGEYLSPYLGFKK
jgi:hypothetical protein